MTKIQKIPETCKHGDAIHLAVDPPTSDIKWSLSEGEKIFAEGKISRRVPEIAFYLFRPRKLLEDGTLQELLKKGDTVTVTIEAGDATVTGEIKVT